MDRKPFSPTGKTVVIAAATTAPSGVQVPEEGTGGSIQCRLHNAGSVMAYLAVGTTAGNAQSNAVVPESGTPQRVVALPAGVVEVLSFPLNSYFSAITESGTAKIYVTPGRGV